MDSKTELIILNTTKVGEKALVITPDSYRVLCPNLPETRSKFAMESGGNQGYNEVSTRRYAA